MNTKYILTATAVLATLLTNAQKVSILSGADLIAGLNSNSEVPAEAGEKLEKKPYQGAFENTSKTDSSNASATVDFTEQVVSNVGGKSLPREIGQINYTKGIMEAQGKVFLNKNHLKDRGREYAITMAFAGAEVDARANLLAMIMSVEIHDSIRVVDKVVEQRVTVQTLHGFIKATIFNKVVGDDWVQVTARCMTDDVYKYAERENMLPPVKTYSEEEKEEARMMYLQALKDDGIIPSSSNQIPPLVTQIPKSDAATFNPQLVPNVTVKCNGAGINLDMSKFYNKSNPKAVTIVNAVRSVVDANGSLKDIPVVDGFIKNGNLEVDLCKIARKQGSNTKVAEAFSKVGPILMQILPMVAMFL